MTVADDLEWSLKVISDNVNSFIVCQKYSMYEVKRQRSDVIVSNYCYCSIRSKGLPLVNKDEQKDCCDAERDLLVTAKFLVVSPRRVQLQLMNGTLNNQKTALNFWLLTSWPFNGQIKAAEEWTIIQPYGDWSTGRFCLSNECYAWTEYKFTCVCVSVCHCVYHTFCQLAYRSDPQRIFTVLIA